MKQSVVVRLEPQIHAALKKAAGKERRSMGSQAAVFIVAALGIEPEARKRKASA